MSIRKIKTNSEIKWEARVYLQGKESKRISMRFDSRAEAEMFMESQKQELRRARLQGTGVLQMHETTLKDESEYWITMQEHTFSRSHFENVKRFLNRLLPKWGHLSPNKFNPGLLSTIQVELLREKLKPSTVNRHLQVIGSILSFSCKHQRIAYNPAAGFSKLKEIREGVGFWTQDEASSFLTFMQKKYPEGAKRRWVYVAYLTALNTGVRAGELWGLMPKDLDSGGDILIVQRQFSKVLYDFCPTKGRKVRRVPCNPMVTSELKKLIFQYKIKENETLFQNEVRKPVSHDNFLYRCFDEDIKDWGGKRIRFHDLRHTATTLMVGAGVDLKTVQEICGHENIRTTMNYAHLLSEKVKEVARTFSVMPTAIPQNNVANIVYLKAPETRGDFGQFR